MRYSQLIKLKPIKDQRGMLCEVFREDLIPFKVRQVNIVEDSKRGIVRAWHKHAKSWEAFICVAGKVTFVLYDDRRASDEYGKFKQRELDADVCQLLVVPPGVFHGHIALSNGSRFMTLCSSLYCKRNPDETRCDKDDLPYSWEKILK